MAKRKQTAGNTSRHVTRAATPSKTGAHTRLAAQRASAARERIETARRRRRLQIVLGATLAVVLVAVVLIVVKVSTGAGGPSSGQSATAAQAQVIEDVSHVPVRTLDAVGSGTARTVPTEVSAPVLTSEGKPEVLYVGAEYCPYCAAERWAVAVAMSRFGTLHGVGETASAPDDVYPDTRTLDFHGATLTSSAIDFVPEEIQSNKVVDGQYAPLDTLTKAQQSVLDKYDTSKYVTSSDNGSIPFVDIGGRYLISGASYDPGVLKGKTHQQIAAALQDASSSIARAVDGTANLITAAVCSSTHDEPSATCRSQGVTSAATRLRTS